MYCPCCIGHLDIELLWKVLQHHLLGSVVAQALVVHRVQLPAVKFASIVFEEPLVEVPLHGFRKTYGHTPDQRQQSRDAARLLVVPSQPTRLSPQLHVIR